eukprot:scaffold23627_cov121-Isochrysis_galbana.AAC.6
MPRYTRATFVSRLALTIAELIAWIVDTYPLPLHPSRKQPKPRSVSLYLTYLMRVCGCKLSAAAEKRASRVLCVHSHRTRVETNAVALLVDQDRLTKRLKRLILPVARRGELTFSHGFALLLGGVSNADCLHGPGAHLVGFRHKPPFSLRCRCDAVVGSGERIA